MYEIDFLPVGDGEKSGDAITLNFTRPDTGSLARVVVDAGFQDDGDAVVGHVERYYKTSSLDLAILTHPDGDHIGGMGTVVRDLDVAELWLHRLSEHGGEALAASDAVEDLIEVARSRGTRVVEAFAGAEAFGGALTILGPTLDWYEELVAEQVAARALVAAGGRSGGLFDSLGWWAQRFVASLSVEVPFDDAGGTNPRNNSSMITLLDLDGYRALLTADAGVPALDRAWDWLEEAGMDSRRPDFVQIPHHGSRHNASSAVLDRLLGPKGQAKHDTAFISVAPAAPKHPSPRVVNAYQRRGYRTYWRDGDAAMCQKSDDAPARTGWVDLVEKEPMDESGDD